MAAAEKTKIYRGFRLITGGRIYENAALAVRDGKIDAFFEKDPGEFSGENTEIVEGGGLWLAPGFIEMHSHGAAGFDFLDGVPEEYIKIAAFQAACGVTTLYPTTLSASREELLKSCDAFNKAKSAGGGARLYGIHLEGPYIAKSQKGAMDEKYIRDPIKEEYTELCDACPDIRRMTVAPELPGAAELGEFLRGRGILPSVGHTDCDCCDVEKAYYEGGFTLMTHLYSSMTQTRRIGIWRHAGAVEAAYLIDGMNVEIIADGCHLPPDLLRLIYKLKGPEHTALTTDSMRAAGQTGGESILGSRRCGQRVIIDDGVAKMPDMTAFAGSIATYDRLVRTMLGKAGVPLTEVMRMSSETPAKIMGIYSECGSLDAGKRADLTAFDDDISVKLTVVGGQTVHAAAPFQK